MDSSDERYAYNVDWFDTHAQITRQYQLFFTPSDYSFEMVYQPNKVRSETQANISKTNAN